MRIELRVVGRRWPRLRTAACRTLAVLLAVGALVPGARAARRSEKQLEMDRQREEMRRQAEQKRQNPNAVLTPPVLPSRSSASFAPLVVPPPSAAVPAPAGAGPSPAPGRPDTANAPAPAVAEARAPAPAAADAESGTAVPAGEVVDDDLRRDASFQRGAALFNSALELFKKYETGRDASHLATIPDLCEKAAGAFEAAGASRPDDRRIARYVEQCHGLARYARQSSLMESGSAPR